jgi:hypothetical protein
MFSMATLATGRKTELSNTGNDAATQVAMGAPFIAEVTLEGNSAIIFHRWSVEGIAEKANAAKGSKAKKTDDVESYVYKNDEGYVCIPGEYLRQSIIHAAKYRQDPRSPRKSMMDLAKAAIFALEEFVPIANAEGRKTKQWDYIDQRRVTVQRNGLTRSRPAFLAGWRATFTLQCVLPEYVDSQALNELIQLAGKIIGLADGRPSYGRFLVVNYKVLNI